MAEWRKVQTRFWDDPDTLDMTPEDRLFYIYLLTNPLTTSCGVYTLHPKQAVMHTGYNLETVQNLIKRFVKQGYIEYDEETREVLIIDWFKFNSAKSDAIKSMIHKELEYVKSQDFHDRIVALIDGNTSEKHVTRTDTLPETVPGQSEDYPPLDIDIDVEGDIEKDSADKSAIDYSSTDKIIDYLNAKIGKHFDHKPTSRKPIHARLAEGATPNDCKLIIDFKTAKWKDDPDFSEYLRPSTLFRPAHLEEYLNAAIAWDKAGRPDPKRKKRSIGAIVNGRGGDYYDDVLKGAT